MLDMAFGLTDTSRLGCQVKLTRDMDGISATLPSATRNMFVDGAPPLVRPSSYHLLNVGVQGRSPRTIDRY